MLRHFDKPISVFSSVLIVILAGIIVIQAIMLSEARDNNCSFSKGAESVKTSN